MKSLLTGLQRGLEKSALIGLQKSALIARRLLLANRWLWLLLVLWPWVMAAILRLGSEGVLAQQDVLTLLQQECLYGLALVAFTGGALLGNEQRSRRIVVVLARAVGRGEYLFALWLTAVLPLLLYVASVTLAGRLLGATGTVLWRFGMAEMLLGIPLACLTLFWSIWVPGVVASTLSLALMAGLLVLPGPGQMALATELRLLVDGGMPRGILAAGVESACVAAVVFAAAVLIFRRRDLNLKSD
jgi:hypothetical protein